MAYPQDESGQHFLDSHYFCKGTNDEFVPH
jgi:hypothetical protein